MNNLITDTLMQSTCCCRNSWQTVLFLHQRWTTFLIYPSLFRKYMPLWYWKQSMSSMLWFVVRQEMWLMLADDETLHAYSGLPPWQKGHWFNYYKVYSNSLTQWNVANRKFQLVSNEKLESKRQKSGLAVTRIRTWVVTATTWSTNHYTITARNPAALAAIFKH